MVRGLFISGTDTEVGKTFFTSALASYLRSQDMDVGVFKPVATGGAPNEDAELLKSASGSSDSLEAINPVCLPDPLSPNVAADLANQPIDLDPVLRGYARLRARHEITLVEGAGGLLVPILDNFSVADLALEIDLPLLIVARSALGTINHTLLTLEAAAARGLEVRGVIYNTLAPGPPSKAAETSPDVISEISGIPSLGTLPYSDCSKNAWSSMSELLEDHIDLDKLLKP